MTNTDEVVEALIHEKHKWEDRVAHALANTMSGETFYVGECRKELARITKELHDLTIPCEDKNKEV